MEAFHGKGTFCSEKVRHTRKSRNIAVVTTYISDYIFSKIDTGYGSCAFGGRIQYYSEKYRKQPSERGKVS